ncbi:MAG: NEW3 domain-containing protein [Candidatus Hydrogenedentota bacterium]
MNKWAIAGFLFGIVCLIVAGYILYAASQQDDLTRVTEEPTPVPSPQPAPSPTPQEPATPATPAETPQPDADRTAAEVTLVRSVDTDAYVPGDPLEIQLTIDKEGTEPLRALGISETLPPGWRYEEVVEGGVAQPDVDRQVGNQLEFAWINIPDFPLEFAYRVKTAPDSESVRIGGMARFRTSGDELQSDEATTTLAPGEKAAATTGAEVQEKAEEEEPEPEPAQAQSTAAKAADTPKPARTTPARRPVEKGLPGTMRLTYDFSQPDYTAGQPFPVTLQLQYNGSTALDELRLELDIPEGWTAQPEDGEAAAELDVAFENPPAEWPLEVPLTLLPPEEAQGMHVLRAEAIYQASGDEEPKTSGVIGVALNPKD